MLDEKLGLRLLRAVEIEGEAGVFLEYMLDVREHRDTSVTVVTSNYSSSTVGFHGTQVPKGRGAKRGELRGAARAGRAARAALGGVAAVRVCGRKPPPGSPQEVVWEQVNGH